MSGIFSNFNKAIAVSPKVGRSHQVRIFRWIPYQRGLTGTSLFSYYKGTLSESISQSV